MLTFTPTTISLSFSFINIKPFYPAWLAGATLTFIFCLSVQVLSNWRHSKRQVNVSSVLLDEEATIEWDGILGPNTWTLLVPPRKHKVNILILSLLASVISFLSSVLLRYPVILSFFKSPVAAGSVYLFCWVTVLVSLQSVISPPPETSTWRHVSSLDLQALARPVTLILCQTLTYLGIYFWNIFSITNIAYLVQTLLPLTWLLGILPPMDCFILWAGEQVLVYCFGGSQTSSSAVLCLQLLAAAAQLAVTSFSALETRTLLTVSSSLGYVLSTNWSQAWRMFKDYKVLKYQVIPQKNIESNNNIGARRKGEGKPNIMTRVSEATLVLQELLAHILLLIISTVLSILIPDVSTSHQTALALGWVVVTLQVVTKTIQETQKVFFLFGLIRSPFYDLMNNKSKSSILKMIIRCIHPVSTALLLQTYILLSITTEHTSFGTGAVQYLNMLATQRSLRWIWQNTDSALVELAVCHILRFVETVSSGPVSDFSRQIPFPLQLVLTSFLLSRLSQCLEKLYLFFCLSASAVEEKTSRRPYAFILFQLNIFLFPVIGSIIGITSLLSSPMLSMFTLPIFFISYPRPSRFWPGEVGNNAASSSDSVYYQHSASSLLDSFNSAAISLRLGALQPESMFLARFEDKIFWIRVLEKGNGYITYNLKGLELQETSCHSLEATKIDDIFEATFEKKTKLNNFSFHSLTPLTQLPVRMYSDTRNNLTTILTSPDTLENIGQIFLKVTLWMMIKQRERFVPEKDSVPQPIFDDVVHLTPAAEEGSSWESSGLSGAWASRTLLLTPELPPIRQKLATINLPVQSNQTDNSSLSDFGDIDDHLRDIEKFLEPVAKHRSFDEDKTYFQQLDALPGIVEKSNKHSKVGVNQVYQTPSRFLESEDQFDQFSIPSKWKYFCEKNNTETGAVSDWFPVDFYHSLLEDRRAANSRTLTESYCRFVRFLFEITFGKGSSPNNVKTLGTNIVMKNFTELSVSDKNFPTDLYLMIISAFRSAVKIAIDMSVLGDLDDEDLMAAMEDILENWYIGMETSEEWKLSVRQEVPNLFTIDCFKSSENRQMMLYKSRILNLKTCQVSVGRLNKEVVKSLWASLSLGKCQDY